MAALLIALIEPGIVAEAGPQANLRPRTGA
jgi:hypothetical protein